MKLHGFSVSVRLLVALLILCGFCEFGYCTRGGKFISGNLGGVRDIIGTHNSNEIDALARFAIEEHNKRENTLLEFARVLKAKEQVVAGKLYHLTMEASDAGKKKIYEAKVWVKPWLNFKHLEEFKHVQDISPFTTSDLGVKQDGYRLGWRDVSIHDSDVKGAASHAVEFIAQKSNSLSPYQLVEIVLAKAKVVRDYVKFTLLLKIRRGIMEERFRVEVNKQQGGGKFYLSRMQQDRS